jgi:pimeloyl-ACP methyl ester carboxylesterase
VTSRVEDVLLRAGDGARLVGDVYHPCGAPRGGVVVVHGFSASRRLGDVVDQARSLADDGFLVLAYDLRGHGKSGGECTLGRLEADDLGVAVAHLRARVPNVVIVGASLGAVAVLAYAIGDPRLAGIVLVSMPTSWRSVFTLRGVAAALLTRTRPGRHFTRRHTGVRISPEWQSGEPPTAQLRRVHVPVAIVHGRQDRMIRSLAARELYSAASEARLLELVDGMGHSFQATAVPAVTRAVEWAFEQERLRRPRP